MPNISSTDSSKLGALIHENTQALEQLAQLVARLSAAQFQQCFGLHSRHSAGRHVRHIIDHYDAFLQAASDPASHLDYANRRRDSVLERSPDAACKRLAAITRTLEQHRFDDRKPRLVLTYPTASTTVQIDSSAGRELVFLFSHAVHHMAIIGLLAEQLGVDCGSEFGVHPTTLRHWQHADAGLRLASSVR